MKIAWIQIVLSLVLGIVLGVSFDRFNDCHCAGDCIKPFKFGHRLGDFKHKDIKHILKRFSKELNLTAEQKTQVSAIFDAKHKKMIELKAEVHPKFEALRKSAHDEINKLLTVEQQKKFDEIDAKIEAKHKKWDRFGDYE